MTIQSNIQFTLVNPNNVPLPAPSYYALFLADGSNSTIAGVLYRKDSSGVVTIAQDTTNNFTVAKAQDAVGGILQTSDTVQLIYDTTNRLISATVKAASIATTHLVDGAVTPAKLAPMADGTFLMRPAGAGTGVPVDGTAVQAKASLGITYSDVSGLGTAATQPASAFDTAGAAAAAQNASQPLDVDLTAISQLTTTSYGRSLLTVADVTALTALPNLATQTVKGLLAPADKVKLDNRGNLGVITSNVAASGIGSYTSVLAAQVPAGTAVVGSSYRVRLYGYATGSGTVTFRIHAGATGGTSDSAVWTSVTSPTLATNQRAGYDGMLTMRSSSLVVGEAHGYGNTTTMPAATAAPTGVTVNTASNWYITLSVNASLLGGGFSSLIAVVEAL